MASPNPNFERFSLSHETEPPKMKKRRPARPEVTRVDVDEFIKRSAHDSLHGGTTQQARDFVKRKFGIDIEHPLGHRDEE